MLLARWGVLGDSSEFLCIPIGGWGRGRKSSIVVAVAVAIVYW